MSDEALTLTREPCLFDSEEEAGLFLLLPDEELKQKVKTAASLRKVERLKEAVLMLLPAWPLKEISRHLGISRETLAVFASRESEKVGHSVVEFKQVLRSTAARWLFIASLKEQDATFPQLTLGVKLMMDAAAQLEQTGLVAEEKVIKEDRKRLDAVERLNRMREAVELEEIARQAINASGQLPDKTQDDSGLGGHGAVSGAIEGPTSEAVEGEGVGGGAVGGPAETIPMGPKSGEILPKESAQ